MARPVIFKLRMPDHASAEVIERLLDRMFQCSQAGESMGIQTHDKNGISAYAWQGNIHKFVYKKMWLDPFGDKERAEQRKAQQEKVEAVPALEKVENQPARLSSELLRNFVGKKLNPASSDDIQMAQELLSYRKKYGEGRVDSLVIPTKTLETVAKPGQWVADSLSRKMAELVLTWRTYEKALKQETKVSEEKKVYVAPTPIAEKVLDLAKQVLRLEKELRTEGYGMCPYDAKRIAESLQQLAVNVSYPPHTTAILSGGTRVITAAGVAYILLEWNGQTRRWDVTPNWDREAAEALKKLPTDPSTALDLTPLEVFGPDALKVELVE